MAGANIHVWFIYRIYTDLDDTNIVTKIEPLEFIGTTDKMAERSLKFFNIQTPQDLKNHKLHSSFRTTVFLSTAQIPEKKIKTPFYGAVAEYAPFINRGVPPRLQEEEDHDGEEEIVDAEPELPPAPRNVFPFENINPPPERHQVIQ